MGSIVKPSHEGIYGTLLHIYPQSFRKHYGTIMVQTFDDMLENERSSIGRLRIWTITLMDMPFSAAKEHITNGGGISMNRNFKLLLGAALAAILIAGAGSWWLGSLHARRNVGIERVTPAQLADAMQQDSFYSAYGDTAVLFSGKVLSVTEHNNTTLVTFTTGRPYSVTCQFASNVSVKNDQTLSIAAPAGSAERQTSGVLLHNCLIN